MLFRLFFTALLSLGASSAWADLSVTVQSLGEAVLGQDLAQANSRPGPWVSQAFVADILPRHSYTLHVRSKLDEGSHPVFLKPYFVLDTGETVTTATLQAHDLSNTAQDLCGIVAPLGTSQLRYALAGSDSSVSWWRDLQLIDEGLFFDGVSQPTVAGGISFTADRLWVGRDEYFDFQILMGEQRPGIFARNGSELDKQTVVRLGAGHGLVRVNGDAEALRLTWDGCAAGDNAAAMGLMVQAQPQDVWILPFNEGLRVPVSIAKRLNAPELPVRSGHFMSLPLLALQRGEGVLLIINETPDDSTLRFWPDVAQAGFRWLPIKGSWGEARSLRLQWIPRGGVNAVAQAYRRYVDGHGSVLTLGEKATRIPGLASLAGALDLHYFKNASWWARDEEPMDAAKALRQAGLDRVLWSQAASISGVQAVRSLGFLAGRYENFQDTYAPETALQWMNTEGWPAQLVLTEAGQSLRGWAAKDGQRIIYAGVRNSEEALRNVRDWLLQQPRPYDAIFFDTTTASGPVEDWSHEHPLTRTRDLSFKTRQLEAASLEHRLITGSESGHDGDALNAVHYFEGMLSPWPGRFDDAGYDLVTRKPASQGMLDFNLAPAQRIPLFELVYHDSVVNYPYWGDASNRLPEHWRFRDLLSCLYGQPEIWVMDGKLWDEQRAQAAKSYATWSPVVRHLFGQKMLGWKAVDAEAQVQETRWQDGSTVRVDFAQGTLSLEGPVAGAAGGSPR